MSSKSRSAGTATSNTSSATGTTASARRCGCPRTISPCPRMPITTESVSERRPAMAGRLISLKNSKTWLLIDVSNLCWKAWYTTGDLTHQGVGTGVLFGFLRMLKSLQQGYGTQRCVFCFDLPPYKRKLLYPGYKQKVEKMVVNSAEARDR